MTCLTFLKRRDNLEADEALLTRLPLPLDPLVFILWEQRDDLFHLSEEKGQSRG